MADLVLLGGGGHARSLLAAIELQGQRVRGYVAPEESAALPGIAHMGADDVLDRLPVDEVLLVNGLGTSRSTTARRRLHDAVRRRGFAVAQVLHPRAFIDPGAVVGPAVQVLAGAIVNVGADLAEGVLVNTGAIVEHDSVVGAHAHIAPGALLAGGVRIGSGAFVGLGARVLPGVRIGAACIIGAGAVVVDDIAPGETAFGVPARPRAEGGETT